MPWSNSLDVLFRGFENLEALLGRGSGKATVQVPFLVTKVRINQAILDFNSMKVIMESVRYPKTIQKH